MAAALREKVLPLPEKADAVNQALVQVFKGPEDLTQALAEHVAEKAREAVARSGSFTIALAGGSLIQLLQGLEKYSGAPIEWSKWYVLFVDERVVPLDSPDSNFLGAMSGFLARVPIPRENILAIDPALPSASAVAADYAARLIVWQGQGVLTTVRAAVEPGPLARPGDAEWPVIDLALLGVGPDGHIASLFPGHPLLSKIDGVVASIEDSPKPPPQRITLTLPVINFARNVTFALAGSGKAAMLHTVLEEFEDPLLPAQRVRPFAQWGGAGAERLRWMVDEAAAAQLAP